VGKQKYGGEEVGEGEGAEGGGRANSGGALLGRAGVFGRGSGKGVPGRARGGSDHGSDEDSDDKGAAEENGAGAGEVDEGEVHKSRLVHARARRVRQTAGVSLCEVLHAAKRVRDGGAGGNASFGGAQGRAGLAPSAVLQNVLRTEVPSAGRNDGRKVVRVHHGHGAPPSHEPLFKAGLDVSPFEFDMY
jgi:hypothetical protein